MDKLTSILSKWAKAKYIDHIINKIASLFLIVNKVRKYTVWIRIHRTKSFTLKMTWNSKKWRTSKNIQLLTLPRNRIQREFFRTGSTVTRYRQNNHNKTLKFRIQQSYSQQKHQNRKLYSLRTNERLVNISWVNQQVKVHLEKSRLAPISQLVKRLLSRFWKSLR